MRTVVDTSALIALLYPKDKHNQKASELLNEAYTEGGVFINDVVFSELAADPYFDDAEHLGRFLEDTGIRLDRLERQTLFRAGEAFRIYLEERGDELQCPNCGHKAVFDCPNCGSVIRGRQHIASDFIIGAHAEIQGDKLISFDVGFFKKYFDVKVSGIRNIDPLNH